jgi:hypothetical protein
LSYVDPKWLRADFGSQHRLSQMWNGEALSIVKGVRPESEVPAIHRFLQALRVCQDFLDANPYYDHFAGALLVPQIAALGTHLGNINQVGGDTRSRIQGLWKLASNQSDSAVFELLVATACAERGRQVEFLEPDGDKTPDLRCHDPFPMVIECKRKRVLSDYEIAEEATMRRLFYDLDRIARSKGVWGCFEVHLNVDHKSAPLEDIVECSIRQRLAPHPERALSYAWGTISYRERPYRFAIANSRIYSPSMLNQTFGWNSDLPAWDGIVCRVGTVKDQWTDQITAPTALLWCNHSERAIRRRSWSPLDVFGDAMSQIPAGEFGVVYVAYQEGTRAEIADSRTENFQRRMREWAHSAKIRVPAAFLIRLYPRPLENGLPDLIESTVRMCADTEGAPEVALEFPGLVFGIKYLAESYRTGR